VVGSSELSTSPKKTSKSSDISTIIHVIANAHTKCNIGTKSQRSAVAFSMLCAYTFMMSDRASIKQHGHHPQKGYLCTLGDMICGKTLLD
jgi:hypothetical protein